MEEKKRHDAEGISTWWGTDSSTQSCCEMPQDFYIGRMGYGGQSVGDAYFFNTDAANAAGQQYTYGYWGVVGPESAPVGWSPVQWGQQQANNAWNARSEGPHASYIGGLTIFADVEPGFGGWSFGNFAANQGVLNGFLTQLFNITPHEVWPGLYISPYYWSNLMGQGFRPGTDFVLWLTGCDTCGADLCNPCDFSCNTLTSVSQRLTASILNVTLGGRRPVLWQYWIGGCQCGDYNVITQHAASLVPVNGNVTYNAPC